VTGTFVLRILKQVLSTFFFAAFVLSPTVAYAYIGPGAGVSLVGALGGLVFAVVLAIGVVLLWPLRKLRRRLKQKRTVDVVGTNYGENKSQSD